MRTYTYYDGDTFERHGATFRVTHPYDDTEDAPWDREDGHGPVSEWRSTLCSYTGYPSKRPGERILHRDGHDYRTYDYAEAIRQAKREGWGLGPDALAKLRATLGREPTKGEIAAAAVEKDFNRLRRWCANDWCYVGVVVELLGDDGKAIDSESLWGIESDAGEYLAEVAHELADEIARRRDLTASLSAERAEWAARDVVTEASHAR